MEYNKLALEKLNAQGCKKKDRNIKTVLLIFFRQKLSVTDCPVYGPPQSGSVMN